MIVSDRVQVYIVVGHVDMRKAIDGLSFMVSHQLSLDPLSGHMFAFSNRRRNVVKVLYWDSNGFALWQKRLERDRFQWPESRQAVLEIGPRELRWLLDGLALEQRQAHRALSYSAVC